MPKSSQATLHRLLICSLRSCFPRMSVKSFRCTGKVIPLPLMVRLVSFNSTVTDIFDLFVSVLSIFVAFIQTAPTELISVFVYFLLSGCLYEAFVYFL